MSIGIKSGCHLITRAVLCLQGEPPAKFSYTTMELQFIGNARWMAVNMSLFSSLLLANHLIGLVKHNSFNRGC